MLILSLDLHGMRSFFSRDLQLSFTLVSSCLNEQTSSNSYEVKWATRNPIFTCFFFFLTISFHCGILFLIGLPFHVDHTLILQHFGQRKFYNSTFIPPKNHFHHSMNSGGMEPTRWVHFQNQTLLSVAGDMPMHARHHIPLSI